MSYDVRIDVSQLQANLNAMRAERDANWEALDRLRTRLRKIVPDVVEGGDLVCAVEARLAAAERRAEEAERALGRVRSTIEATFGKAPTPGSVAFDLLRTVDFALARSPGDHTEDGT